MNMKFHMRLLIITLLFPLSLMAQQPPTAQDYDQLAYACAVHTSGGIRQYVINDLHVSPAHIDIFVRGLREKGATFADAAQRHAYQQGNSMGETMRQLLDNLNYEVFGDDKSHLAQLRPGLQRGYIDMIKGQPKLSYDAAKRIYESKRMKVMQWKFRTNKTAGERFLRENSARQDVQCMSSGLQYKVITNGTGRQPRLESKVKLHYEGRLIDGTVFDSSYRRGEPNVFSPSMVIEGFKEALLNMTEGSTWEIYIPYQLAYGEKSIGKDIKPYSALIFKIEMLSITEY